MVIERKAVLMEIDAERLRDRVRDGGAAGFDDRRAA